MINKFFKDYTIKMQNQRYYQSKRLFLVIYPLENTFIKHKIHVANCNIVYVISKKRKKKSDGKEKYRYKST